MEEERVYNELSHASFSGAAAGLGATPVSVHRTRTVSSPVPVVGAGGLVQGPSPQAASIPSTSRPLSPGLNYGEGVQRRESGHTPLFTPPPTMIHHGRVHSLTTPPGAMVGVPSPSPPPPTVLPPSGAGRRPIMATPPHIVPPTTSKPPAT